MPQKRTKAQLLSCASCAFSWRDGYCSWSGAVAFDRDLPDALRKRVVAHPFSPLDNQNRFFITQQIVEIDGVGSARAFVESIKIDVVEL